VDALGGAISGELVLTADGRFTRVVNYARSGVPEPWVARTAGMYRVRGAEITFRFFQDGKQPPLASWELRGEVRLPSIVFRDVGPADEAVEEEYVRSTK
jgi:hypothetical protein